jgi:ABC-type phosphate/phosphonate transport system permease subunit
LAYAVSIKTHNRHFFNNNLIFISFIYDINHKFSRFLKLFVSISMKRYFPFALIVFILALTFLFPSVEYDKTVKSNFNTGDIAWMLMSTALVLIMTPGLAFFYGGMVNKKNVISTMLQSIVCMVIITVLWGIFGFSLAFGDSLGGIIGNPSTYFMMKGMLGNKLEIGTNHTIAAVCHVPAKVCYYYPCAYNRRVCRAYSF